MDGIILEVTDPQQKHTEDAAQLFQMFDNQATDAKLACPNLSSVTLQVYDVDVETMAEMDANKHKGIRYDRDKKMLWISGYRYTGDQLYFFHVYSKPVDEEPDEHIKVVIGGVDYFIAV